MSKNRALIPALAGTAGVVVVGTLAYAFTRRTQRTARAAQLQVAPVSAARLDPAVRESMVVPRSAVPEPLTVVLDLDGVFRSEAELEPAAAIEVTVQCDVKLPSPAGADDGEPPEADSLGSHWLSRATPSERSLSEGDLDLDLDLDNPADVRDDGAQDDEVAYGHDQERKPGLVAAAGWRRG